MRVRRIVAATNKPRRRHGADRGVPKGNIVARTIDIVGDFWRFGALRHCIGPMLNWCLVRPGVVPGPDVNFKIHPPISLNLRADWNCVSDLMLTDQQMLIRQRAVLLLTNSNVKNPNVPHRCYGGRLSCGPMPRQVFWLIKTEIDFVRIRQRSWARRRVGSPTRGNHRAEDVCSVYENSSGIRHSIRRLDLSRTTRRARRTMAQL